MSSYGAGGQEGQAACGDIGWGVVEYHATSGKVHGTYSLEEFIRRRTTGGTGGVEDGRRGGDGTSRDQREGPWDLFSGGVHMA